MRGEDEFIPAAMRLRGAAPREWEEFILVMRKLAAIKAAELVRAPPEAIHQMQGQARAFEEIVAMMIEAPAKYERGEEMRRGRPNNTQHGPPQQ